MFMRRKSSSPCKSTSRRWAVTKFFLVTPMFNLVNNIKHISDRLRRGVRRRVVLSGAVWANKMMHTNSAFIGCQAVNRVIHYSKVRVRLPALCRTSNRPYFTALNFLYWVHRDGFIIMSWMARCPPVGSKQRIIK